MHRFYVPSTAITSRGQAAIHGETARQIGRVLRMQPGDTVCLFDGSGHEYVVRLSSLGRDVAHGEIIESHPGTTEPSARITLYLALLNKPDKWEWAIQKCTEVGAAAFVPLLTARAIAGAPAPSRYERWSRIIQEAAEQSGRTTLPLLKSTLSLTDAIIEASAGLALIPTLDATMPLSRAVKPLSGKPDARLGIFIGPEGGFTPDEIAAAEAASILPVTLGPRTLRAETAAPIALALALHSLGDMG
jgi:16S rRNA (uracil1498-N3)-methyltransferase